MAVARSKIWSTKPDETKAAHAIEMAKPWLAWRLICFAAQLCVAAGFHDESLTIGADKTRDTKALLFWHVFALEKTLALRVGRASLIRDCDINLSKDIGSLSLPPLWDKMVPFWVANALIHGKLYELLYSRAAQSLSQDELVSRADQLLVDLQPIEPFSGVSHTLFISCIQVPWQADHRFKTTDQLHEFDNDAIF